MEFVNFIDVLRRDIGNALRAPESVQILAAVDPWSYCAVVQDILDRKQIEARVVSIEPDLCEAGRYRLEWQPTEAGGDHLEQWFRVPT